MKRSPPGVRHAELLERIQELTPIPPEQWERAMERVTEVQIPAKGCFLEPGDDSDRLGLIKQGLFRVARVSANGEETIKRFCAEGEFLSAYAEMLQRVPSMTYLQALEPSVVLAFDRAAVEELEHSHPCWGQLTRCLLERQFLFKEQREQDFLDCGAEERWERFQKQNPHLVGRLAQRHIAAYLGITQVTLSRLSSKRAKRRSP